ncbi:hypothetical protein SASPL_107825 [Salvia splendens]|uniref:AT-rich interactive domain-containing protein 2 n=1 Tax=Salvia splendens TaxID=180675 RepID=A0A8X8YFL3_SALSN|nr:uncharacterized protein LOC121797164 [Salvia splendens]KAG6429772.1 hypothetical protein SASPL_107825 [Salvia splendens]
MFLRMGVKRPLEEENLPELSFEQPKQHDSNKKPTLATEDFPSRPTFPIVNSPGEAKSKLSEIDSDGMPESGGIGTLIVDKELDASIPFSLATTTSSSSSRGEHFEDHDFARYYNVPGVIDLTLPRLPPEQHEDPYVYLLNCPPRKEVPVGPDHQAEVPEWDPSASGKNFSGSRNFIKDELVQKLMGTCIIPSPGLNDLSSDGYTVGRGRADCVCPDMGSVRCVQHHVREAREKLRYTIGDEIFVKLGFYEMGEEITQRWTTEDEQLFHKVVISNPASLGRDFWKDLAAVFPSRTKKEFVSYYFNVFMLRKRGVQNRSYLSRIDSDDDEDLKSARVHYPSTHFLLAEDGDDLHHTHGEFHHLHVGGDGDSDVGSLSDQDLDAGWADRYGSEPEIVCGDKGSFDNHETFDGSIPKKDDVDEGGNHGPATSGGNVPKPSSGE